MFLGVVKCLCLIFFCGWKGYDGKEGKCERVMFMVLFFC